MPGSVETASDGTADGDGRVRARIAALGLRLHGPHPPHDPLDAVVVHGGVARTSGQLPRVDGQLTFNSVVPVLGAAIDGLGLAYVPDDLAAPYLADGRLRAVLDDWCPMIQGYHLYYPSRRQASPAFTLLLDALRHRP